MSQFDVIALSRELEELFGLELEGSYEEMEGGQFAAIRPTTPSRPNGFSILVSRMSRQVEASFRLDNQAMPLLSEMAAAEESDKSKFCSFLTQHTNEEIKFLALVNNQEIQHPGQFPSDHWNELVIECSSRLPHIRSSRAEVHTRALLTAMNCLTLVLCLLETETLDIISSDDVRGYPEGARIKVEVNRYERNSVNRAVCIAYHGVRCQVCRFDFEAIYGKIGRGFIHVHHLVPLSQMRESYRINPITELVPLCPNCHAMVHKKAPPFTIEELRVLMATQTELYQQQ